MHGMFDEGLLSTAAVGAVFLGIGVIVIGAFLLALRR